MKKHAGEGSNEMNKKIKEIMKTDVYTVSDEATIAGISREQDQWFAYCKCKAAGGWFYQRRRHHEIYRKAKSSDYRYD